MKISMFYMRDKNIFQVSKARQWNFHFKSFEESEEEWNNMLQCLFFSNDELKLHQMKVTSLLTWSALLFFIIQHQAITFQKQNFLRRKWKLILFHMKQFLFVLQKYLTVWNKWENFHFSQFNAVIENKWKIWINSLTVI
jgi:hypothetical protein